MRNLALLLIAVVTTLFSYSQTPTAKPIKDTVIKGKSYPLYQGAKGGKYIIVMAKDSSHTYKRYFTKAKGGS